MKQNRFLFYVFVSIFVWSLGFYAIFHFKPITRSVFIYEEDLEVKILTLKEKIKAEEVYLNNLSTKLLNLQTKALSNSVIAILIIACNRIAVRRTINSVLKYRPSAVTFPIIISQDCNHKATRKLLELYAHNYNLTLIVHPDQSPVFPVNKNYVGYYYIARHYGWALSQVFNVMKYETVIILEDDLDISSDFFEYFWATLSILKTDPTLWCVSAWNDNGKSWLVDSEHSEKLHRSDFFSGLGWMMTNKLWQELSIKWPDSFWDDWMREPQQRKNRSCIRPEVSRTITFGEKGTSQGQFYEKHLKNIKLNDKHIPFTQYNLNYLYKKKFDTSLYNFVKESTSISSFDLVRQRKHSDNRNNNKSYKILYKSKEHFIEIAETFGLMADFKSGVPRTAYLGIITFNYKKQTVYLVPDKWKDYNSSW